MQQFLPYILVRRKLLLVNFETFLVLDILVLYLGNVNVVLFVLVASYLHSDVDVVVSTSMNIHPCFLILHPHPSFGHCGTLAGS